MAGIKTIKLSNCEVDIATGVSWLQKEEVEAVLIGGAEIDNSGLTGYKGSAMVDSKIKAMEVVIKEIRVGKDKKEFSKEWVETLSVEDGNLLMGAIDELFKKKQ